MSRLIALAGGVALAGCATLPSGIVRPPSAAIPASPHTTLSKAVARSTPDATLSGFRLLPYGPFALQARLEMARLAEHSLDVQYYYVANDGTGGAFLRALRDAARRGVRVRLLLDDLATAGEDQLLSGLEAEPHLQIRLFNPFPFGRSSPVTRFAGALSSFDRLNHRMHNKLFIADGALAVAGGRNIADEYFERSPIANYIDLDVLVAGRVVPELATLFDQYWNSERSYPLASVVAERGTVTERLEDFEALAALPPQPLTAALDIDALGYGPLERELHEGRVALLWGEAEAWADVSHDLADPGTPPPVRFSVLEHMRAAKREVDVISPYLIPGQDGMQTIRQARERGVAISVLTNSLASTDQLLAHAGYSRYREALLEAGVDLYELSVSKALRVPRWRPRAAFGGVHAKVFIFDRSEVFIGSMNFDPRSELYNTEIGIIFHSPELARQTLALAEFAKSNAAHRVRLDAQGRLLWEGPAADEGQRVHHEEPEAGVWRQMLIRLLAPFAPERLL